MNTNTTININDKRIDFDAAVNLMDDDIRERLANDGIERTPEEFFGAYAKAHKIKYVEEWELSKNNPVW